MHYGGDLSQFRQRPWYHNEARRRIFRRRSSGGLAMSCRIWFLALASSLATNGAARTEDKPAAPSKKAAGVPEMRQAVERGLASLEKDGLAWWQQRKCNGC